MKELVHRAMSYQWDHVRSHFLGAVNAVTSQGSRSYVKSNAKASGNQEFINWFGLVKALHLVKKGHTKERFTQLRQERLALRQAGQEPYLWNEKFGRAKCFYVMLWPTLVVFGVIGFLLGANSPFWGMVILLSVLVFSAFVALTVHLLPDIHGQEKEVKPERGQVPQSVNPGGELVEIDISHDLAEVVGGESWLKWQLGQTIVLGGRTLGRRADTAEYAAPHALVIGASGAGKTHLLRPLVRRWTGKNPAAVFSTKGDIIPDDFKPAPGQKLFLITPLGRNKLDHDGQKRLNALEEKGMDIINTRWDITKWIAGGEDYEDVSLRADAMAACLAEVSCGEGSDPIWPKSAQVLLNAAFQLEVWAQHQQAPTWRKSLQVADSPKVEKLKGSASSLMFAEAKEVLAEPIRSEGIVRVYENLENLIDFEIDFELSPELPEMIKKAVDVLTRHADGLKAGDKMIGSVWSTALSSFGSSAVGYGKSRVPFDAKEWAQSENGLLVVVIPSTAAKTWEASMAALATVLWDEASSTHDKDHLLVLDEIASLAPVPGLSSWVAQGRSMGVVVVAVLQNEGQARKWTGAGGSLTNWILSWPLCLVASGSPAVGIAEQVSRGEGHAEVERATISENPDQNSFMGTSVSTSRSLQLLPRLGPEQVFGDREVGLWRVLAQRLGPWVRGIE